MIEKVRKTIEQHRLIEHGDVVVVGVSGGPDSLCLLHVLHSFSDRFSLKLHAIHINHLLRGSESEEDEAFTAAFCRKLGIPLQVCRIDVACMAAEAGISLEEAGREARYREFNAHADAIGASRIAVAHHRDDQAETVLMHILRGTGLAGLVGMELQRGRIIRPLLDISRQEIEEYCKVHFLHPRTDSSNLQQDFIRNRIRLDLIPHIQESFGVDITENLCRLASLAADDHAFLEQCARDAYQQCRNCNEATHGKSPSGAALQEIRLCLHCLRELHPALRGRVIRVAVKQVKGDLKGVEHIHIGQVAGLIEKGRTGAVVQLPADIRARISYNGITFYTEQAARKMPGFSKPLNIPGLTDVEELGGTVRAQLVERSSMAEPSPAVDNCRNIGYNAFVQFFDYSQLRKGMNIRNRREGDRFKPLGAPGSKKLKEYLIDQKVPKEERDRIPLIAVDQEIVWIIGYKISDKFKVTENTKSILRLEYQKAEN